MVKTLDNILLSDNVVNKFYSECKNSKFVSWLNALLPEIEDCKNLKQDNPWHIFNCLEHMLHSVEEINKLSKDYDVSTRRMLAYTMFLHDIGKPQCYLRRYSKLYKREVDSFFNHNLASVKIADRVLKNFNFSHNEQETIKTLIKEHDMFMFITLKNDNNPYHKVLSYNLINEKIEELNVVGNGKELLNFLILVGRADNKSQNPEMTKESLYLIEVMESMLSKAKEINR